MSGGDWKDLFKACEIRDLELARFHIKMGIDPNYQHPEYLTSPLMECIRQNNLEIADYLLQNGADPHLKEAFGTATAFSIAKSLNNKEAMTLLSTYANKD